jgi:hypothetical protein
MPAFLAPLAPMAIAGGKALATYAALVGTDYVINRAVPRIMNKIEKRTFGKRKYRRINAINRKIARAYHSPAGQFGRGFATMMAGSAIKSKAKGSKGKKITKSVAMENVRT